MTQPLNPEDKAIYEWQLDLEGLGKSGQEKLKNSTAVVSRIGGLGGPVAMELAAAGVGNIILVHGGNLKHSDLNRQILMSHDGLGKSRVEQAKARLNAFNPNINIECVPENFNEENTVRLVERADIVFDCAPLFEERFLMNRECIKQGKPLIDAAMYGLQGQVTSIIPGETACLQCIYPEVPKLWKRRFPVIGAVSALAGCIAAIEGIKWIAGMEMALAGKMLYYDTQAMTFRKVPTEKNPDCPICAKQ